MKGWNKLWQSVAAGIIGVIALAGFSLPAWADENQKMVVVTGVAVLQGENIAGARQTAVQDALRQAVEQGVGMLMNATSILKNDELMEKIYTNTQGYITRYEIIKERKERNGLYRVKVQAGVKTGALRDTLVKLGIIKAMMDYPRIMIIPYLSPAGHLARGTGGGNCAHKTPYRETFRCGRSGQKQGVAQ